MKIVSGRGADAHVTSAQFRQFIEGTVGSLSCILQTGERLEPELASNNLLRVKSGMMCHHSNISSIDNGTYDEITIQNGTQGMKRIDLVVNRYTIEEETEIEKNEWVVIQGTPAESNPTVPAYTEGDLRNGDLIDDCPVFEVELDGINVTEVRKRLNLCSTNEDTGWIYPDISGGFEAYTIGWRPRYRRVGNTVEMCGAVRPTKNILVGQDQITIFSVPAELTPKVQIPQLCQGSLRGIWYFEVGSDGDVTVSRFRNGFDKYSNANTENWFPFNLTYFVD